MDECTAAYNFSYHSGIDCSPYFALYNTLELIPALEKVNWSSPRLTFDDKAKPSNIRVRPLILLPLFKD